jgi:hypothetical protein
MHSEGKLVTGSMIIEKPKAVCDELTDECIFAEDWLQNIVTVL